MKRYKRIVFFLFAVCSPRVIESNDATQCYIFPGMTLGQGQMDVSQKPSAGACCDACTALNGCQAWTFHAKVDKPENNNCFLKDNVKPLVPPRPVDKNNNTMSGLKGGGHTCNPHATPVELCPEGYPCPQCGASRCTCEIPKPKEPTQLFGCLPPHDKYTFCNTSLTIEARVKDLISRINDTDKANMLTARGMGGNGQKLQDLPAIGVPGYYWGTNCLHSLNGPFHCVNNTKGEMRCPTNFPSGPSFGATFDRSLIQQMANQIGVELRASVLNGMNNVADASPPSLDCWGPVINLNRDPRWGRNGEGGTEDAYAMGELAEAWTKGFQAPRPSKANPKHMLYQGIITLKHMAVNSLENTFPYTRHNFDANETFGVDNFVVADYYLRPFKSAIAGGGARGIMCSYNAVLGKPTCLSPLIRNARKQWGFEGYVTSDSDSVQNAYSNSSPGSGGHGYPGPRPTAQKATALALTDGQCDINSGDTYNENILAAISNSSENGYPLTMDDVDRALFNSLKQRFDLGLFDPKDSYEWPTIDEIGSDSSRALSLKASQESIVLLRNDAQLLPLPIGKRVAVIGPHWNAQQVLVQPYPFSPFCPDKTLDCIVSPTQAIAAINDGPKGDQWTRSAYGCDLFNSSKAGFAEALALAKEADYVILALGIETCGMTPAHNVNPAKPGSCYQEKPTTGYVFPDQYLELEAHDRTTIDLPQIQHDLAAEVLALNKPTVMFLMNGGAVAIDAEAAHKGVAPLAIIEAFYPGMRGGEALAQGIFGEHNKWGRLPYTIYPKSFTDEAEMSMHDLRHPPGRTYRYYQNPLFSFGTGLSLSTWSVSGASPNCLGSLSTSEAAAVCKVQLKVGNTGRYDGDIVITAYFKSNAVADPKTKLGVTLLEPIKELFDFTRVTVASGSSVTVSFNVTAASVAQYAEPSGDKVATAGGYTLMFEDGAGGVASMNAVVEGDPHVVDPFPSDKP